MSGYTRTPKIQKAGLVVLDRLTGLVDKTITLQYNPESLTRTLELQKGGGDNEHPARISGPPAETFSIEAYIDAVDQLEDPDNHESAVKSGIHPQLAQLELIVSPSAAGVIVRQTLNAIGLVEIIPPPGPVVIFAWGKNRIQPVEVTSLSVVEEDFDNELNPIRARVTLGMRSVTVDDSGMLSIPGALHLNYMMNKESLAAKGSGTALNSIIHQILL